MNKTQKRPAGIFLAWFALWAASTGAYAQADKIKLSEHIQSIKFGGDLRLRHENFNKRGLGTTDRNRNRLRLRLGAEMQLPHDLSAKLRLASGTGEQVSTNQTYTGMSSQKNIFIDQAFLHWTPAVSERGSAYLASGKMQNLLWRTYSSDLIWDDDVSPEGFAEGGEWLFAEAGVTVFGNALQMAVSENGNTSKNPWLFSQQLGAETRLPLESRMRLAGTYHKWSNENRGNLGAAAVQDGNRRAGTLQANRFGVGELTGEFSSWIGRMPISFQATVARNFRARGDLSSVAAVCPAGTPCPQARDGYQIGAVLGRAKAAGTWEAAWFKKYAQTDATMADIADSDFGDGGTNRRGHIFWAAYAPTDWMQLKAKYFVTETIDTQFNPGDKAVNRLQIDMSVKF
ncbi:MAG: putative porin [Elusimicrobia bacterium]|nr:putative porin [Elusimicrobiota bacterium]